MYLYRPDKVLIIYESSYILTDAETEVLTPGHGEADGGQGLG